MLNPPECSNIVWAYASVMIFSDPMFEEMGKVAVSMIHQFDLQNVSNSFWAFACVVLHDAPLLAASSGRAMLLIPEFSMQELANVA